MAPGDEVTNPITVTNGGSLELRYAVTSTTTENTLAGQLDLTIKTGVTTCTNGGFGASGNETLCFNVELPASTGDTFQGLNTTATFAFQAEQTSSNP
jgi:hypothetical protein